MDPVAESLLTAQRKAEALFATVVELGMIRPGLTESELSLHIHELASAEFGLRRGRTYALGADPHKHRLIADIGCAFRQGQRLYQDTPDLSAGALYDFVAGLAQSKGWEFGAETAGHLVGRFPHERPQKEPRRFSIRHGNATRIREPDDRGAPRH